MNDVNIMQGGCIDNGSENCPCYLAETGDCLVCSRLQGKDFCDCCWSGICVYNEFVQGNYRVNNPRKNFSAKIVEKKLYTNDLVMICLSVDRGFALKAAKPGSFVFLQPSTSESYYSTPVSVLKADSENGLIYLLIKSISAKTKAICVQEENLIVRGVYRSGISYINQITGDFGCVKPNSKLLVLTKGVGFAPAVNLINWANKSADIDLVIDKDKICGEVIWDFLLPSSTDSIMLTSLSSLLNSGFFEKKLKLGDYTAVIVLASEYFIEEIKKAVPKTALFLHSNNANLCCGEGICGSCTKVDSSGNTHKCCKCF